MTKLTHALVLGALMTVPAVALAQTPTEQRLNDFRDNHDTQSTTNTGRPGLPPMPTPTERTTGMPANSPAPPGLRPNPSPQDRQLQRLQDEGDKRDSEGTETRGR